MLTRRQWQPSLGKPRKPDVDETIRRLAAALTRRTRRELTVAKVLLTTNKHSVVQRVDILASDGSANAPLLQLIEKRGRNRKEYRLYHHISRSSISGWIFESRVAPKVYSVVKHEITTPSDYKYSFLLEHLTQCGLIDLSAATARRLAEGMSMISTLRVNERPWITTAPNQLTPGLLNNFITIARENGHVPPEVNKILEAMERDWHKLASLHSIGLPLVPCHNDLHILNLGARNTAKGEEYCFFDWEHFALNFLGSDLHHFICLSISQPQFAPFCDALRQQYKDIVCCMHDAKEREVELAGLSYTLYRCMVRSIKRGKSGFQMKHVIAIYKRLQELLLMTAAHCML